MSDTDQSSNLPAQIAAAIAGIPPALVPACVKALDRLIGAAVDIPVAWFEYQKAKIVSRTEAFRTIDEAITTKAATKAGASEEFADRALKSLVRKSYRQLDNKEAVSAAMLEDLGKSPADKEDAKIEPPPIDDDWLNVFERYAEDASTERMQKLWGRVLAGQIRAPGKYSLRTLRFLSEFSQDDAASFSSFGNLVFSDFSPRSLAIPYRGSDMRNLLNLESSGLIQGISGSAVENSSTFNSKGHIYIKEGPLTILLTGPVGGFIKYPIVGLTPLGIELLTLLPNRDVIQAARVVAASINQHPVSGAYLMVSDGNGLARPFEVLWAEPGAPIPGA